MSDNTADTSIKDGPHRINSTADAETTQPGLTQNEDGTISIGPGDQKRAEREAFGHAQKTVIDPLNEETEKAGDEDYITGDGSSPGSKPDFDVVRAEPGAAAGDGTVGKTDNS